MLVICCKCKSTLFLRYAAKMAVVAANTGHLVLTTLHASRASSCVSRLIDFGVNEDHLYENLLCISNQRMMVNKNTKEKIVLYEIMNIDELTFYRNNKMHSEYFNNINSQISKGIKDGIF